MGKYSSQRELDVVANQERAKQLAETVITMYHQRKPPFQIPDLFPDTIIPEGMRKGSRRHALFLFHTCSMDSMVQASEHYSNMRDLAKRADFEDFYRMNKEELEKLLQEHQINLKLGNPVETLQDNSRNLKKYDQDPRRIYTRYPSKEPATDKEMEDTFRRLGYFRQFRTAKLEFGVTGIGKTALLVKNYVRFGIWPFDESKIPIKIDRHAARICIPNVVEFYLRRKPVTHQEVINVRSDRLVHLLTDTFLKVTRETGISAVELNDALWAIGSYLCSSNTFSNCKSFCDINCATRPKSDETVTVFYPGTEKRVHQRKKNHNHHPSQIKLF